jgi:peptidoglycan/xylan/chitin deacetylase (PgdA/CDA1 family)
MSGYRCLSIKAISLGYHDVTSDAEENADTYALDVEDFLRHMQAIHECVANKRPGTIDVYRTWVDDCPVFLTFDDGAVSAHSCVAGVLERFGWRGHFFVTTGLIGRPGFMTTTQIRDLRARGHVIGSHSHSHPEYMSSLSDEKLRDEWCRSCTELSGILGEPVKVASVPAGYSSPRVARIAAAAGIEVLFDSEATSNVRSVEGCLVLGRYSIRRNMSPAVSGAIAAGRRRAQMRQEVSWRVRKGAKMLLGGERYRHIRYFLLYRRVAPDSTALVTRPLSRPANR